MEFKNVDVWGFEHALRGMRNPLESWAKADSGYIQGFPGRSIMDGDFEIGPNDMRLAKLLIKCGAPDRKFLRQIFISVDITAPLYWWKEFDTYKIGTVANSTSTMHKLASTPITRECFENMEVLPEGDISVRGAWRTYLTVLEDLRQSFRETNDKRYWKLLIQMLPEAWLQTRTVTMNYENVRSMVSQRKDHKLTEWEIDFIEFAHTLPYSYEFIFWEGKDNVE